MQESCVPGNKPYVEDQKKRSACLSKRKNGIFKKGKDMSEKTNCIVGMFVIGEDLIEKAEEYDYISKSHGHDYYMKHIRGEDSQRTCDSPFPEAHSKKKKRKRSANNRLAANEKMFEFYSQERSSVYEKYSKCIRYIANVNQKHLEIVVNRDSNLSPRSDNGEEEREATDDRHKDIRSEKSREEKEMTYLEEPNKQFENNSGSFESFYSGGTGIIEEKEWEIDDIIAIINREESDTEERETKKMKLQ